MQNDFTHIQFPELLVKMCGNQIISLLVTRLLVLSSGYCCPQFFILSPHFFLSHWYFAVLRSSFHLFTGGRAHFLIRLSNANLMNLAVKSHGACTCTNIHKCVQAYTHVCSPKSHKSMLAYFQSQVDAKIQTHTQMHKIGC